MLDNGGAHPDRPRRVAINTKKLVVFRNRMEKSRSYSLEEKPVKAPTQDNIDKAYSAVQMNHDTIGCSSGAGTMMDMVGFVVGSKTAGETWYGVNAAVPDAHSLKARELKRLGFQALSWNSSVLCTLKAIHSPATIPFLDMLAGGEGCQQGS